MTCDRPEDKRTEAFGFETRMIHAGAQPEPITGARQTPIYQNIGYSFHDVDNAASLFNLQTFGFIYSRLTNPRSRSWRSASPTWRTDAARPVVRRVTRPRSWPSSH